MPNAFLNCTSVLKNMALEYVKEYFLNQSVNCTQIFAPNCVCVCVCVCMYVLIPTASLTFGPSPGAQHPQPHP